MGTAFPTPEQSALSMIGFAVGELMRYAPLHMCVQSVCSIIRVAFPAMFVSPMCAASAFYSV
jgi:hypothetical protein